MLRKLNKIHLITSRNASRFRFTQTGNYVLPEPQLANQFTDDPVLKRYFLSTIPKDMIESVTKDLGQFGWRVADDIWQLHRQCELEQPRLVQYNVYGKRVDQLVTSSAWKMQKQIVAEEGIVAIAYERNYAEFSRLYQIAKLYLYAPSSGLFSCPVAMTDGAAKVIEDLGVPGELQKAYKHLTSRDKRTFWTSGQWMTEKRGGSDVAGGTETIAIPDKDSSGMYKLYGYKFFSSASDSDMSLALARVADRNGNIGGLSLFYLETRDYDGLNGIQVIRLKDKLGTRQLPTAELLLDGCRARMVGTEGRGIPDISSMLSVTRLHNATAAAAGIRRIVNLARDYARRRSAFGRRLIDWPLHTRTLAAMDLEARAATLLLLDVAKLFGRQDVGVATKEQQQLFRILTPLMKLYTAKQGVDVTSEGLECFGGLGYLEDSGLPNYMRDAHVLPIWEGTTNILSMDVLRSMAKSDGSTLLVLRDRVQKLASSASSIVPELAPAADRVSMSIDKLTEVVSGLDPDQATVGARELAYSLARVYMGALLLRFAGRKGSSKAERAAALRWCSRHDLCPILEDNVRADLNAAQRDIDMEMIMEAS